MTINDTILRVNFKDGVNESGQDIIRSRNYRVNRLAEDAGLVSVGEAIFSLTEKEPHNIERINTIVISS